MAKKSFRDSARASVASAFLSGADAQNTQQVNRDGKQYDAQQDTQDVAQEEEHKSAQEPARSTSAGAADKPVNSMPQEVFLAEANDVTQEDTSEEAHDLTQVSSPLSPEATWRPVRTQGRKGKKKPRINMAFEPVLYEFVRNQAELEDKSITQCVNDILYQYMITHKK